MSAPAAAPRTRLVGLDGPRGIACLCVMTVHAVGFFAATQLDRFHLTYLGQAIVFFFALSGFLIYLPFVRAYADGRGRPSTSAYATQRVFRIYPGYVAIFLLANLALAAVYTQNASVVAVPGTDEGAGRITDPARLLAHLTLTQNLMPGELQTGIGPSWSLTTELGFYVAVPVLSWLLLRRRAADAEPRLWVALLPAAVMAVVGAAAKLVLAEVQQGRGLTPYLAEFGPNGIAVAARSTMVLADNFAYGMVAVTLFVWVERGGLPWLTTRRLWVVAPPLWLGLLVVGVMLGNEGSRFIGTALAMASGVFLLFVSAPAARGERSWFAALVDLPPIRYVGTISLSVYLWHYPVILLVARHDLQASDTPLGMVGSWLLVAAVTIVLSSLTYHLVEAPGQRAARRLRGRVGA